MKVGIIGCGAIANIITGSIAPENNGIEIAYFFDKDVERAAVSKRIKSEGPELYWEEAENTVHDVVSFYYDNAYLAEDGIVFFFEPYLLASYAQGFIDVKIPYDVLTKDEDEK